MSCEGCGVCFHVCPEEAVILEEGINGRWFISETRFGPMAHAELFPGEENSGKLVALVRNQAKVLARSQNKSLILVDGAPGVGCPVISSVTGADHVLIVTEPSLSGLHDMERAVQLVQGFRIPMSVVINKYDVSRGGYRENRTVCPNGSCESFGQGPVRSWSHKGNGETALCCGEWRKPGRVSNSGDLGSSEKPILA